MDYGISRKTLAGVLMCFNLKLFIDWLINRYFNWSGSGALVEINVEEVIVNRSTYRQSVSGLLFLNKRACILYLDIIVYPRKLFWGFYLIYILKSRGLDLN